MVHPAIVAQGHWDEAATKPAEKQGVAPFRGLDENRHVEPSVAEDVEVAITGPAWLEDNVILLRDPREVEAFGEERQRERVVDEEHALLVRSRRLQYERACREALRGHHETWRSMKYWRGLRCGVRRSTPASARPDRSAEPAPLATARQNCWPIPSRPPDARPTECELPWQSDRQDSKRNPRRFPAARRASDIGNYQSSGIPAPGPWQAPICSPEHPGEHRVAIPWNESSWEPSRKISQADELPLWGKFVLAKS